MLAFQPENDLQETVGSGRKGLVNLNSGKIQFVSFDRSDNCSVIDLKMDVATHNKK